MQQQSFTPFLPLPPPAEHFPLSVQPQEPGNCSGLFAHRVTGTRAGRAVGLRQEAAKPTLPTFCPCIQLSFLCYVDGLLHERPFVIFYFYN